MGSMKDMLGDTPYVPYQGRAPAQSHSATSLQAAAAIQPRTGPLQAKVLDYLRDHPDGATDEVIGAALAMDGNTLRPRRRELELSGRVVDSGRRGVTRSGRQAVVWVLA